MAKVSLRNVSKIYPGEKSGDVAAVNDVSIDVADREFLVLVGPSGCGKSTTLRMIAGLEEITRGEISIGDRVVNDVPPKDRDIAMVFQNYALYPHMSVAENMAFALKLRKFSKTEIAKRVEEAAVVLGIEDLLERKPKALSGGQRQRVAVGRAIVRQPKVFLFDEPLSNLDAKMRVQMRSEIKKLHQRLQATMIYVTHDQVEAMTMGDRIAVMNGGAVQQLDTPLALYNEPANLFVAGFLGSPAMNIVNGTLKQERDALVFQESGEGTVSARFDPAERPALAAFAGKAVVLGIRPEAIAITERSKGKEQTSGSFPALVDLIEATGAETNLHLDTGAHALVCRSDASLVPTDAGRRMYFQLDLARAHLFDPTTTLRIV